MPGAAAGKLERDGELLAHEGSRVDVGVWAFQLHDELEELAELLGILKRRDDKRILAQRRLHRDALERATAGFAAGHARSER